MKFYLNLIDGEDRPYITSNRPSKKRQKMLIDQGASLFEIDVEIPGWKWKHGKLSVIAKPMKVD